MTDKQPNKRYTEDDIEIANRILAWVESSGNNSFKMISELTGIPDGTLRPLLSGQYNAKPSAKLAQIIDAVERQKARDEDGRSELPHVETTIHKSIHKLIGRAHRDRDIGIFAGNPGIGKTRGLVYYAMRTPGAALVGAQRGLGHRTFMQTLADACRIEVKRTAKADEITLEIIKALAGTDRIILVDEANYLSDQSLDTLRRISDMCGIAVMLIGLPDLISRIQGLEGRLGQLASRISFWPPIARRIDEEDCKALVSAYFEEDDMDVGKELVDAYWKACCGSARLLRNLLRNTLRATQNGRHALTAKLVERINQETMAGSTQYRRAS